MEVIRAARDESGLTYVDFNTGHYEGDTYLDILEPYIRRIKKRGRDPGRRADAAAPRPEALRRAARDGRQPRLLLLRDLRPLRLQGGLPGQGPPVRPAALPRRGRVLRVARRRRGRGTSRGSRTARSSSASSRRSPRSRPSTGSPRWARSRPSASSGPLAGTDYADMPAPQTEPLVPVFRRLYEACMEKGLPIGVAPNIHVSLVLLPDECRSLSERSFPLQTLKLKLLGQAAKLMVGRNIRAAEARAAGGRRGVARALSSGSPLPGDGKRPGGVGGGRGCGGGSSAKQHPRPVVLAVGEALHEPRLDEGLDLAPARPPARAARAGARAGRGAASARSAAGRAPPARRAGRSPRAPRSAGPRRPPPGRFHSTGGTTTSTSRPSSRKRHSLSRSRKYV